MKIVIYDNAEQVAEQAANIICQTIKNKPKAVLGLATGRTPLKTYQHLIKKNKQGSVDFSQVSTFNLDEYLGVKPCSENGYRFYMDEHLFNHINIKLENTTVPCSDLDKINQTCLEYEQQIKLSGGIDLQLLGLGSNGHVGFNEPSSSFASRTRVVALAASTLSDNSELLTGEPQTFDKAISMGIATILDSKEIVIIALGKAKAQAVASAIEGALSASCPASCLQMHANVTWLLDQEATSLLTQERDYQLSQQLLA